MWIKGQQCQGYSKRMFTESFGFMSLETGCPECGKTGIQDTG